MNRENIQLMVERLKLIPPELFDIGVFIKDIHNATIDSIFECNTACCVVGWCVPLDKPLFEQCWLNLDVTKLSPTMSNQLRRGSAISNIFLEWSEKFTGLSALSYQWQWCFSSNWNETKYNTPEHAIGRMEALLNGTVTIHPEFTYFKLYVE